MKRILLLFTFLGAVLFLQAAPVSQNLAKQVARNLGLLQSGKLYELQLVSEERATGGSLYYIFNVDNGDGFVIVSGDDAARPILGYSRQKDFVMENQSPSFLKWMEWYKYQLREIRTNNLKADSAISAEWNFYLNPPLSQPVTSAAAGPLLTTTWDQSPYYNALCPYDNSYSQRTVSGCVATAMAQIMKHWDYPAQGKGSHSYNHDQYGTLSANFGATTYNWSSMPADVNSSNTAVATLMYHAGVSVDMNYGVASQGGSGAYVIESRSPVTHCSEYAFKTYFDYDPALVGEAREDFTQTAWIQKLKTEIDQNRPVLYAGFGQGGHAFVCDGYDNNNYFHFNWGWGGIYDGYFSINSLNPGTGGAGAGAGTYNNGQQAIFGVKPANPGGGGGNTPVDIFLYSAIQISPNPVNYLQSFSVSVDIANGGTGPLNGSFAAAVFNSDNQFIDWVQTINSVTLTNGYYSSRVFSTSGLSSLVPGAYKLGIYYREGSGEWKAAGDGSYTNFVSFNVVGAQGDIRLYAAIVPTPNPIETGKSFKVDFNIANYNQNYAFQGVVSVDLHKSDGTWIKELQVSAALNLSANSYFTNGLTFTIPDIDEEPGTYKLQLWYKPNGDDWNLVSSGVYANPINIQVVAPGLSPDIFETNNTQGTAKELSLSFVNNKALMKTTGSTIHNGTDLDYYKLVLPAGYTYTITARAHDNYNSGNGLVYTCDVTLGYHDGTNWSESFDDIIPGTITVPNGGTITYLVSPYFTGQTGTYLLDLSIERVKNSGVSVRMEESQMPLKAYPNPIAQGEKLRIEIPEGSRISSVQLFDSKGMAIACTVILTEGSLELVAPNTKGIYFARIATHTGLETLKVIVTD